MKRYLKHMIRSTEKRVEVFLDMQCKDRSRIDFGGMKSSILEVKPTIYVMTSAVAVYVNSDSVFYKNEKLYQAMNHAIDFIERMQREDGSFDYPSCNFKSAPDTSFCFKRLIAAYRLLVAYQDVVDTEVLQKRYLLILEKSLHAIRKGGFHTPNHRWAIMAALLQGADLFKDNRSFTQELKERAALYLQEGIDGNEDGEYAERSTGNYNAVVNNAMMSLYEETKDPVYLGYIRRNLHMMLTYIDPDDTIFTQNSTRQDQGSIDFADKYFYQYLYMATMEKNCEFDAAAHKIIKDNLDRGDLAPDCLHILMLHKEMMEHCFSGYGFLETYKKFYEEAGVLRVKRAKYTYTVIKNKSAFLFFKVKNMQIYMKIGESYCDIRNFKASDMKVTEKDCYLSSTAKGWYYLPFQEKQETSDWWKMDHEKREKLISSTLQMNLKIEELEDGLQIQIKNEGLDRVPLRVEICVPAGGVVENTHFYTDTTPGNGMILREDYADVKYQNNTLKIGPGFGTHEFQGHYSGEEKNASGYTIYCNDYSPYERTLYLKIKESE